MARSTDDLFTFFCFQFIFFFLCVVLEYTMENVMKWNGKEQRRYNCFLLVSVLVFFSCMFHVQVDSECTMENVMEWRGKEHGRFIYILLLSVDLVFFLWYVPCPSGS